MEARERLQRAYQIADKELAEAYREYNGGFPPQSLKDTYFATKRALKEYEATQALVEDILRAPNPHHISDLVRKTLQAAETPIGEDTRPKDWVKLGMSPSATVVDVDCTGGG
jgi:hypothetical protein